MDGDAGRKNKPIAKLLLLTDPPNILAANHLQQAAEKILSAVRLHRGLLNTKDHDLVILIDGRPAGEPRPLPAGDPWRDRFRPLESLSAYATTFRYSLTPMPKIDELRKILKALIALHESARAELLTGTA
jgi:HEPN domain